MNNPAMTSGAIEWFGPDRLDCFSRSFAREGGQCRVLYTDLRHRRVLPLLRPAPLAGDYADEARPATNDRAYFLARRAALRSLVAMCVGGYADDVHIRYDDRGAPRVVTHQGLFVSSSGHGPYAALAVCTKPVGVDFEPLAGAVEPITEVLHPKELQHLESLPEDERREHFLAIWTAKEAYLKALGTGFLEDPENVFVNPQADRFVVSHQTPNKNSPAASLVGSYFNTAFDGARVTCACVMLKI